MTKIIAGIKYSKKTLRYAGFNTAFPIMAAMTAVIAINKANQEDLSGLGKFLRLTFSIILPIPNNTITDKKAIVYTPANAPSSPFVISKIDTHNRKKAIDILYALPLLFFFNKNGGRTLSRVILSTSPLTPINEVRTAPLNTRVASIEISAESHDPPDITPIYDKRAS